MKRSLKIRLFILAVPLVAVLAIYNPIVALIAVGVALLAFALFGMRDQTQAFHDPGPEHYEEPATLPANERYTAPKAKPLPVWQKPLTSVIERCRPYCGDAIMKIFRRACDVEPDILLTPEQARMAALINGAVRDHGHLIEAAIRESLKQHPGFLVWDEPHYALSHADTSYHKAATQEGVALANLPYGDGDERHREVQVDLITFERRTGIARCYEIKRNHLDPGSAVNLQIVRATLVSYCRSVKQLPATSAEAYTITYYANPSRSQYRLTCHELEEHFGFDVCADVDKATGDYRAALQEALSTQINITERNAA
jgi:hypothetical protein